MGIVDNAAGHGLNGSIVIARAATRAVAVFATLWCDASQRSLCLLTVGRCVFCTRGWKRHQSVRASCVCLCIGVPHTGRHT